MSKFDESLKLLLKKLKTINDLSKEASDEINEFLAKKDSSEKSKKKVTEKLLNFTNSLNEESSRTKDCYSELASYSPSDPKENDESRIIEQVNGDSNNSEEKENKVGNIKEESKEMEDSSWKRPMLKIVDFSKLVDPRNLELMDKNHKSKESKNSSIIILSSSEDESVSVTQASSQKSNISNSKALETPTTPVRVLPKNKPPLKDSKKYKASSPDKFKDKLKSFDNLRDKLLDSDFVKAFVRTDKGFMSTPYVKLMRVPCEEMKTFYLNSSKTKNITQKKPTEAILDEKTGELVTTSESESKEGDVSKSSKMKNNKSNENNLKSQRNLRKESKTNSESKEITENDSTNSKEESTASKSSVVASTKVPTKGILKKANKNNDQESMKENETCNEISLEKDNDGKIMSEGDEEPNAKKSSKKNQGKNNKNPNNKEANEEDNSDSLDDEKSISSSNVTILSNTVVNEVEPVEENSSDKKSSKKRCKKQDNARSTRTRSKKDKEDESEKSSDDENTISKPSKKKEENGDTKSSSVNRKRRNANEEDSKNKEVDSGKGEDSEGADENSSNENAKETKKNNGKKKMKKSCDSKNGDEEKKKDENSSSLNNKGHRQMETDKLTVDEDIPSEKLSDDENETSKTGEDEEQSFEKEDDLEEEDSTKKKVKQSKKNSSGRNSDDDQSNKETSKKRKKKTLTKKVDKTRKECCSSDEDESTQEKRTSENEDESEKSDGNASGKESDDNSSEVKKKGSKGNSSGEEGSIMKNSTSKKNKKSKRKEKNGGESDAGSSDGETVAKEKMKTKTRKVKKTGKDCDSSDEDESTQEKGTSENEDKSEKSDGNASGKESDDDSSKVKKKARKGNSSDEEGSIKKNSTSIKKIKSKRKEKNGGESDAGSSDEETVAKEKKTKSRKVKKTGKDCDSSDEDESTQEKRTSENEDKSEKSDGNASGKESDDDSSKVKKKFKKGNSSDEEGSIKKNSTSKKNKKSRRKEENGGESDAGSSDEETVAKGKIKTKTRKVKKTGRDCDSSDEGESVQGKSTSKNAKKKKDKLDSSSEKEEKISSKKKKSVSDSLSDSDEDKPTKKKNNEESSDSDVGKKRKRKTKSSDKDAVVPINSDTSAGDSDDFGAFCKKNARTRKSKKVLKKLVSDSEEEDTEKKDGSDSEDAHKSSDADSGGDASDKDSGGDASDKETKDEKKASKRKRIQVAKNNSSSEDEMTTRKKIKRLISKDSLSDSTKKAAAEERERKQRIQEKQKKYNQIYENTDIANSTVEKLVLDVDEATDKPLLQVNKKLVSKLKPHQASGIQFMWDACFESLRRTNKSAGSGCILAHCMGLGKTLQVIALTNTLLEAAEETKVRTVLIVTPVSTVLNWKAEYKNWLSGDEDYEVFELVSCKAVNAERAYVIKQWHENGGVMIMSYSMFRNLSNDKNRRVSKKLRTSFIEGLVDPGPDLVVCDEGHLLKNEKTGLSIAMNKIKTRRRIVLTGTPLQNNLKEYYCMVQFVKPNLLGTYKEYMNRFVNPITNGQYTDSTQYDINIMRKRSHVLHKLLDGIVQRRDYSVLSPYLPPKFEYVLFLTLTETQKNLYGHYLKHLARKSKDPTSNSTSYLFQDFQAFSRICIHPRVLLDKSNDDLLKERDEDEESLGSLKDFVVDESDSTSTPGSSGSESGSDEKTDDKKKKKSRSKRVTRAQQASKNSDSESEPEEVDEKNKEWWQEYCDGDELDNIAHGVKLRVLFEILKECEQIGDKVLVFSQSLYALNVIEYFLEKVDQATQDGNADEKTCGYTGSWQPGLDYFRLDGSTNCNLRSTWCNTFNKESNSRARLFLLSTRAGGLGINLVAANRVIVFDVSWNPSSDLQSIYRVYRFGQLKPSYVYRFVIYGTMEMKVYERQVTKQAISKRVIDEQQIDRHYNQNDLAELYKYNIPTPEERPTPLVPKDVLLGELLRNHEDKIFKYHEHQSLLENKVEETLNEEERKAAWDEFENEKVERTKQSIIGSFSINTIQLALKSIIQRDNPTWNQNQIVSIIPQLIQQLEIQLAAGDQSMYSRIEAEIKLMQQQYAARRMQMQLYSQRMKMEAQRQQQLGMQFPNPLNPYFGQFPPYMANMGNMGNRLPLPGPSIPSSNEVVDLN